MLLDDLFAEIVNIAARVALAYPQIRLAFYDRRECDSVEFLLSSTRILDPTVFVCLLVERLYPFENLGGVLSSSFLGVSPRCTDFFETVGDPLEGLYSSATELVQIVDYWGATLD